MRQGYQSAAQGFTVFCMRSHAKPLVGLGHMWLEIAGKQLARSGARHHVGKCTDGVTLCA